MSLSLFQIDQSLLNLAQAREQLLAEDPDANPDHSKELAMVEETLAEYLHDRLPAKVDSYWYYLKSADVLLAAIKDEIDQARARTAAVKATVARLKAAAIEVMENQHVKRLEGTAGRKICAEGNGGLQPLKIDGWDEENEVLSPSSPLPQEFRDVKVTIPATMLHRIVTILTAEGFGWDASPEVPAKYRIREALEELCGNCYGLPLARDSQAIPGAQVDVVCPSCDGTGRRKVPGARLLDRGRHIRLR